MENTHEIKNANAQFMGIFYSPLPHVKKKLYRDSNSPHAQILDVNQVLYKTSLNPCVDGLLVASLPSS